MTRYLLDELEFVRVSSCTVDHRDKDRVHAELEFWSPDDEAIFVEVRENYTKKSKHNIFVDLDLLSAYIKETDENVEIIGEINQYADTFKDDDYLGTIHIH